MKNSPNSAELRDVASILTRVAAFHMQYLKQISSDVAALTDSFSLITQHQP